MHLHIIVYFSLKQHHANMILIYGRIRIFVYMDDAGESQQTTLLLSSLLIIVTIVVLVHVGR